MRQSLAQMLDGAGWQVHLFADAHSFLSQPRALAPSCLLVDVNLPDIGGLELQQLLADRPDTPIVFIADRCDVRTTVRAMKAGAMEFLLEPIDEQLLLGAVAEGIDRSRSILNRQSQVRAIHECYVSLTPREREVMALVAKGRLNKQVGSVLGISVITVKAHRGNVMRKMRAGSLPDLVRMAATLYAAPMDDDSCVLSPLPLSQEEGQGGGAIRAESTFG